MPNETVAVTLPSLGESVTEGTVGTWRKQVGDLVAAGDTVVEIQTDKIDAEVPAPAAGRITAILAEEGKTVSVGTELARIEVGALDAAPSQSKDASPKAQPVEPAPSPAAEGQGRLQEVTLPALGESVTEGIVGTWRKQVGDPVALGEALVEIQTDKVDAELPAPAGGVLTRILVPEGETVTVGTVLAEISADVLSAGERPAPVEPARGALPRAGSANGPSPEATPLARRRAALAGADLGALVGTGPGGLVRGADVGAGGRGGQAAAEPATTPIKGTRLALVQAMEASLAIPAATSVRTIEVGVMVARRAQLNQELASKKSSAKLSYTHLIAFALTWAASEMPVFSTSFALLEGVAQKRVRQGVNLGLAVDVEKRDGSRFLMVPVIRGADRLDFPAFRLRYDELVAKTRTGALQVDDLEGATLTLTNPGGVGTIASIPRLMAGQSAIIAVGAIGLPVGLSQLDERTARELGVAPVMTLTSTYDHRLIQGVESGGLLRRLEQLLAGGDRFYEVVAASLGVVLPSLPTLGRTSGAVGPSPGLPPNQELMYAVAAGMSLVKAHRTHGHLAAHLDPLGSEPPGDPALEPETVKLTPELMAAVPAWMMRVMVPGDTLAEALPHMRQTYCGTIAYEIEHISSHEQRVWLRKQIESGVHRIELGPEQELELLRRLAEVDAFERFLRRTYLGQHTFTLEGLDALVPMLEQTIALLAQAGTREVVL
ncbi:MAG TPA: 2-oxo acid dehydrogenase subunit E2, partial [Candidatus Dormibacteraeota bacterium]